MIQLAEQLLDAPHQLQGVAAQLLDDLGMASEMDHEKAQEVYDRVEPTE